MQNSQLLRTIAMLIGMTLLYSFTGCDKSDEVNLTADFTYEFKDDNHVVFTNTSVGDYYSMLWDFGNNQADTTIDKKETFQVYYPTAADYEVSLKILDYTGNTANVKKTISISKTELLVAFTAVPNPSNPNYIVLTNTSIGDYDSFRWVYRDTEVEN